MSKTTFLKICGVTDPEIAFKAAQLGCRFVGMIFYPSKRRHVSLSLAKEIADAIKKGGAIPVMIFVDSSAFEIEEVCTEATISTVQLHGTVSRNEHAQLPGCFKRIYARTAEAPQQQMVSSDNNYHYLDNRRDYLLFDSATPGTGNRFDWKCFSPPKNFRWILAGGITIANLREALTYFHPDGIDISSGAENDAGAKDITKIQQLIEVIHDHNARA
jgi:phosphoribosylanthranilate isomerase